MRVECKFMEPIEIDPVEVIHFPGGLPAFENKKEFIVIPLKEGIPFYYLQSLHDRELCFFLADIFSFFPEYELELGDEELKRLESDEKGTGVVIFAILTVPDDFRQTTANLLAPVIINLEKRKGMQYIPGQSLYKTRHALFAPEAASPSNDGGL